MTVMVVMALIVNNSLIAMTMVTMTVTAAAAPIIAQTIMKLITTVMTTVHTHMKTATIVTIGTMVMVTIAI